MAALGDIGKAGAITPSRFSHGMFGRNAAAPVVIVVPGVKPLTNVFLITQAGMVIDTTAANTAGNAFFYDMDNGTYSIYSAGTGDVWQATVTTGNATVVKIFTSNRAMARAWVG